MHNFYEIYTLNKKTNEHKLIFSKAERPISSVCKKNDILWIVQGGSLATYDLKIKTFIPIDCPYNGEIQSLEIDLRGNIWFSTYNKLICIDNSLPQQKYIIFDYADGYLPDEYLSRATLLTKSGDIYMGGCDGFLFIDSQIPIITNVIKEVKLLSVELNQKPILPDYHNPKYLSTEVPWNYSSLDINVCVKDDNVFRKNEFRYTIKNINKESVIESDNSLSLPALSSGLYSVYASYLMNNSEWSDNVHIIVLTQLSRPKLFSVNFALFLHCLKS